MLSEDKYFKTLTQDEVWQRYCGFLDLSIDEFMDIQRGLLMDELERVADSILGRKIMGNQRPRSVEEFRRVVPLTIYEDYEPYLSERREDALAEKPYLWCHSAGRGGYFKWIPHSVVFLEKAAKTVVGSVILASTTRKGQINISPGSRFLAIVPPPPYGSGSLLQFLSQRFSFQAIPPLEEIENPDFQDRMQKAIKIALKDGIDVIFALGSVLVRMGQKFSGQAQKKGLSAFMLHPKVIGRLLRAWLRSKGGRRAILPKDLWSPKGILTGGVDTAIYKDDIAHYWGSKPWEFYVSTEAGIPAMQAWNRRAMTFLPDGVFLEFIPEEQRLNHKDNNGQQPSTVLLDELEEGKLYEVVITQLYGMPLLRYRLGDIIKVVALSDDEAGINLPQIAFQHKVGETIELGGLAWLDEKIIWRAIANTGIRYVDWSASKEYSHNQTFLRIYLELEEEKEAAEIETMIDKQLKVVDPDYRDIERYLESQPVRVTLLSRGTFQSYMDEKSKQGADLAHFKPNHINAPEPVIQRLLQLSEVTRGES